MGKVKGILSFSVTLTTSLPTVPSMKSELKITPMNQESACHRSTHQQQDQETQKQIALYRNYCDQVDVLPQSKTALHP